MQVVKPFDVDGVAAAVFGFDLHLGGGYADARGKGLGDDEGAVVDPEGGPGCVDFGAGRLAEDVFVEEGTVESDG